MHWFKTYADYHKEELNMQQIPNDPCLWYRSPRNDDAGLIALQVDDTLCGGTAQFLKKEMERSAAFPNSGRKEVTSNLATRFNGIDITSTTDKEILIDQKYYGPV